MKRLSALAAAMLALTLLAGCLGSSGPDEIFLRLDPLSGEACRSESPDRNSVLLAVKSLTALPGLNRQAVVIAQGNIMRPSTIWYWEGEPATVVTRTLADRLTCSPELTLVAPYSPRINHAAVLSGQLHSFEVVRQGGFLSFTQGVRLELWDKNSRILLGAKSFHATTPVESLKADAVARAATKGLKEIIGQVEPWLKELVATSDLRN